MPIFPLVARGAFTFSHCSRATFVIRLWTYVSVDVGVVWCDSIYPFVPTCFTKLLFNCDLYTALLWCAKLLWDDYCQRTALGWSSPPRTSAALNYSHYSSSPVEIVVYQASRRLLSWALQLSRLKHSTISGRSNELRIYIDLERSKILFSVWLYWKKIIRGTFCWENFAPEELLGKSYASNSVYESKK